MVFLLLSGMGRSFYAGNDSFGCSTGIVSYFFGSKISIMQYASLIQYLNSLHGVWQAEPLLDT